MRGDLAVDLVDDRRGRAGGRHKRDPGGALLQPRQVGGDAEARQVGQDRQRAVGVFRERAIVAALDQRQAGAGAVEGEIDGAREHGLADLRAAFERYQLDVDAGGPGEQQRAEARRDRAGAHVELAGMGLRLGDQLLDRPRAVAAHDYQRHVLGQQRDRGKILERVVGQIGCDQRIHHHGRVHRHEQACSRRAPSAPPPARRSRCCRRRGSRSRPAGPSPRSSSVRRSAR